VISLYFTIIVPIMHIKKPPGKELFLNGSG
jgi:hypothetical protein